MSSLISIYRHYASSPDRWCYTKNIQQGYGWGVGDLAFFAYDQQEPETIPIYQHEAAGGPDRYIYDDNPNDHDGWIKTQVQFYAYKRDNPRRPNTTVPIYQHREPLSGLVDRYYYDTYPDPSGSIVFYAYPRPRNLLNEISGVIGLRDSKYSGVTYEVTEDNTFTLLDTPQLWDKSSTAPETIPACENLLNEITATISQGSDIVDITLMWELNAGLPKGDFQKALNRGFLQLIQSGRRPLVRIMIGIPPPPWVLRGDLMTWVQKTVELYPKVKLRQVEYRILIGACKQTPNSWNHSKIVAADGVRAVVGGHNLWSNSLYRSDAGSRRLGID
jgi:hypothetical protein